MTPSNGEATQPSVEEQVDAEYRAEARRLLVAGVLIATAILVLGVLVVYVLDQNPGMAPAGLVRHLS